MISHSKMQGPPLVQMRRMICQDRYVHVTVYRDDVQVADFQGRIAGANKATAGRDVQNVRGDSSPNFYVMAINAQFARDGVIVQGDEVWTTDWRYRVVSVDVFPHEAQVLMRHIQ